MKIDNELKAFLEHKGFHVKVFQDEIELENWTDGGEDMPFYLDNLTTDDLEKYAEAEQREAMEQDDREGLVRDYLEKLLPENWYEKDSYARRDYFRDQDDPTYAEGTMKREHVSNMEIWCECFGKNKEDLRALDSYAISAIMMRMKGWEKGEEREYIPIYGRQRLYVRH